MVLLGRNSGKKQCKPFKSNMKKIYIFKFLFKFQGGGVVLKVCDVFLKDSGILQVIFRFLLGEN